MRAAVTGGMVLALHELGLGEAFDAAFGSSAGALNALWFVSGRAPEGIPSWSSPQMIRDLLRRRRLVRGGPVVDIATLVERRYGRSLPADGRPHGAAPGRHRGRDGRGGRPAPRDHRRDVAATGPACLRGAPRSSPARRSPSTAAACWTPASPRRSRSGPRSRTARPTSSSCGPVPRARSGARPGRGRRPDRRLLAPDRPRSRTPSDARRAAALDADCSTAPPPTRRSPAHPLPSACRAAPTVQAPRAVPRTAMRAALLSEAPPTVGTALAGSLGGR